MFHKYKNFSSKIADMEDLPFKKESFDIICSSGSLSYGDNDIVMEEIYRLLKPQGTVVIVDSLNNNPIYKLNRLLHYYKGNRTKSTLERMPDLNLISKYIKKFGHGEIKFFGSITWAYPILNILLSEKLICKFSNWIDKKFEIKKSAFKFVLKLKKIIK
jgi:ubiquinone/menaquinone biosynthesis C-methylase UbiE